MSDSIRSTPDLDDPAQLIAQCESMSGGMAQQAEASKSTSAMGGHPNPVFYFGYAAEVFRMAALKLKEAYLPVPEVKADDKPKSTTPPPGVKK